MKNNERIILDDLVQGKRMRFKQIIKSNKTFYKILFKFIRCNKYVWILRNFYKNTDNLFNCISIETCAICNRRCSFCPQSSDTKPRAMMSNELFDKILKELKELNYRGDIILSSFGEPLLDKRLENFIRRIKTELISKVIFFSNGDFLTIDRFRKLVSAGIDLIDLSQHDPEPSEVIKNLFSQISLSELKYISFKAVKEDTITLSTWGGLIELDTLHPLSCNPYRLTVRADGIVPLCCFDYYKEGNFGNVNKIKLIEIWDSSFYRKVRKELKKGIFNLEICQRCRGIIHSKR